MIKFSTQKKRTCPNPTEKQMFVLFGFQQCFFMQPNPTQQDQMTSQQDFVSQKEKNISLRKQKKENQTLRHIAHCSMEKNYKSDMGIG